jgi:bifunctional diaminopimelate decarboxylase / aspartate kinase
VLKFGGTSIASRRHWQTIAQVIRNRREEGYRVFVVCSALSGISNLLKKQIGQIERAESVEASMGGFRQRHENFCQEMGVKISLINKWLQELEQLVEGAQLIGMLTDEIRARIMSYGELCLTTIGGDWLRQQGIAAQWRDARDMLTTLPTPVEASQSRRYLSAICGYEANEALIEELDNSNAEVVITQGFIANDEYGNTVLLGRGGSDSSGAYFAARLRAARLEIWTDVPGMFTTNPKDRPDARLLRLIGYEEAQVLAAMGARVLHPRCIPPVQYADIPLHIRCTPAADMEGTVISSQLASENSPPMKAVASRRKVFMLKLQCPGHWHLPGLLSDVTTVFKRHGLSIDLIANSPQQISLTLDPTVTPMGPIERETLIRDLEAFGSIDFFQDVGSVSLVGSNIAAVIDKLASGLSGIASSKIHMVSQAATDDGLSFVLDPDDVDRVVNPLHDWLLSGPISEETFGPSWQELAKQFPDTA